MSCKQHSNDGEGECVACVWMNAAQLTAAGDIKLCALVAKADEIVKAALLVLASPFNGDAQSRLRSAVDAYEIARSPQ